MLNNCTFVGRLSSDVDIKYTPNGKAVANFSLALTRAIPNQQGEREADFIRCVAWGKSAENMANQLSKGDMIGIQARVQTRNYENNQGQKVYITEFVIEGFPQFLKVKKWENRNNGNNGQANQNSNQNQGQNQFQNSNQGQYQQNQYQNQGQGQNDPFGSGQATPIDISDDDLPF